MALFTERVSDVMAISSFPRRHHNEGMPQSLPSFRELLPEHMHEEIESTTYAQRSGSRPHSPSSPTFEELASSKPRAVGAPLPSRGMPSLSEGFSDYGNRYQTSSSERPSFPQHRPSSQGRSPTLHRGSPSLPPLKREIDSLSDRVLYQEARHYSPSCPSRPNGYSSTVSAGHSPELSTYSRRPSFYDTSPRHAYHAANAAPVVPAEYGRFVGPPYDRQPTYAAPYAVEHDYAPHYITEPQHSSFGVLGGDAMDARNKRRRGNLPKPVTDILRAWFLDHLDHPYPSEEDKQMFINRTGLTISQISNWFINARRRQLPALRNQIRSQEHDRNVHQQALGDLDHNSSQTSSLSPS